MASQVAAVSVVGLGKQVMTSAGPLTILNDINFSVVSGSSVAILGASGSGKTTLLGLLAGLDMPSSGHVEIAGQDLSALDEDGRALLRARSVGFVFQNFQLIQGMTALENVMLPLELAGESTAEQSAEELLLRVGLEQRGHHYPQQLSGGEQQRCAIARAFASRPHLLFADEPTGNLDQETGRLIIELLFALNREQGATLIIATHDESLAGRCERRLRFVGSQLVPDEDG
jgi:putative ABC transport system ATP-binding protein